MWIYLVVKHKIIYIYRYIIICSHYTNYILLPSQLYWGFYYHSNSASATRRASLRSCSKSTAGQSYTHLPPGEADNWELWWSSWWLNQPIWKKCSSNWIISPGRGENKKKWNHHPAMIFFWNQWTKFLVLRPNLYSIDSFIVFVARTTSISSSSMSSLVILDLRTTVIPAVDSPKRYVMWHHESNPATYCRKIWKILLDDTSISKLE